MMMRWKIVFVIRSIFLSYLETDRVMLISTLNYLIGH